jgi:coenzyme F420-reducing hydrogenase delta subunit/formate hydrogenlyase subunit 6/NADH:ubiquinone oxidoreductase subunit I
VLRQGDRVVALECVRMKLGAPDESGRRRPLPVKGSEFTLETDSVLLAIGQDSDLSLLCDDETVVTHRGMVQHDPATLMTARRGLFVAGDVAGTEGFVVDAIAGGLRAARSVDRYLRGHQGVAEPITQPVVQLSTDQVAQRLNGAAPQGTARARTRSVSPETLLGNFEETEIGLSQAEAMAEAARCLGCGICSECLACVQACPAGAIDHEKRAQVADLQVDAVIWTDGMPGLDVRGSVMGHPGVVVTGDGMSLERAVDGTLAHLGFIRSTPKIPLVAPSRWLAESCASDREGPRTLYQSSDAQYGVFLCRCGGEIERTVDLSAVAARITSTELPGLAHVGEIDFACHPEGSQAIRSAIVAHGLDGAVLAACSCCALDQICHSCTTQRTRCKENLGIWDELRGLPLQFVNVREQCAFVHRHHPAAATYKAGDLVLASLATLWMDGDHWSAGSDTRGIHELRAPITAAVDLVRCRGCEDCEVVCGLQAIQVVGSNGARIAQVDGTRCLGCGVCMAVCSSGAIQAGDISDAQAEAMLMAMGDLSDKVVVFSCNWGAYSAIEAAGVERLSYDPSVRLIRLMCAGRAHPGLILRAFAQGAARVLVLACGHAGDESNCHYHTGNDQAKRSVEQAQQLLDLLGLDVGRLALVEMQPADGLGLVTAINAFVERSAVDLCQGRV